MTLAASGSYVLAMATLLVTADQVAARVGLTTPLDPSTATQVEEAILDVQATVEGYLGVALFPVTYTENLYPSGYPMSYAPGTAGYPPFLYDPYYESEGWPVSHLPMLSLISATAVLDGSGAPTGYYTVVYTAGLDGVAVQPIVQFVKAWSAAHPFTVRAAKALGVETRLLKSVSAEGQSATYEDAAGSSRDSGGHAFNAGASLPPLSALDEWRVAGREVFQRRSAFNQYPGG